MSGKPPDQRQLAVAILAIATAAIGFGLFGNNFQIGEFVQTSGQTRSLQLAKLAGMGLTALFYFLVLLTVGRMLSRNGTTNRELVGGPISWFYLEMVSLAGLYSLRVMEELAGD